MQHEYNLRSDEILVVQLVLDDFTVAHPVLIFVYNQRNNVVSVEDKLTTLKITSIGNSAGVLLPKEILTKLRVDKGDVLHVIETENGIELTPYDPEFDAQMAVAEEIMHENRDLLRRLAK